MTDVGRFLGALKDQQERYRLMVGVVEEQKRLLDAGDMDGLMALIERKRALMGEIESLEKEISPSRDRWPELKPELDPSEVRQVEEAVGETRQVLQKIVILEEEGRALMSRQRASTAEELKGLMRKKKARGAYGAPGGGDARFYDDKK